MRYSNFEQRYNMRLYSKGERGAMLDSNVRLTNNGELRCGVDVDGDVRLYKNSE